MADPVARVPADARSPRATSVTTAVLPGMPAVLDRHHVCDQ